MALTSLTEEIADDAALTARLCELSRTDGGAWCYTIRPFSHTVRFVKFSSPCRVPDGLLGMQWGTAGQIGYKGEIVPFTKAAGIREQNRGIGRGQ